MPSLGIRLRAVASIALGVVAGALTNIVTSDFSWVLIAALVTVVAAWMVLVWIDSPGASPTSTDSNSNSPPAQSPSIQVVASERGTVRDNIVEANLSSVEMKAAQGGSVEENKVTTDSTDVHLDASDNSTIKGNRFTATARRWWRNG